MDTSSYIPQLSNDDPLFEVASYTQLLKSKLSTPRHAEYKSVFAIAGGMVNWDAGPFSVDAPSTFNNTFSNTTGALSGAVNLSEKGLYVVSIVSAPSANPGAAVMIVKNGSETLATAYTSGSAWENSCGFNQYMQAGSSIRVVLLSTNSVTNTTRMRITKVAD